MAIGKDARCFPIVDSSQCMGLPCRSAAGAESVMYCPGCVWSAYRAGQEEMRERAAEFFDDLNSHYFEWTPGMCAIAIRELPVLLGDEETRGATLC